MGLGPTETPGRPSGLVSVDLGPGTLVLPEDQSADSAILQVSPGGATSDDTGERVAGRAAQFLPNAGQSQDDTDLVLMKLIQSYDLPVDQSRLYAARQLLARGLPLTRENMQRLTRALTVLGATTEADFQAATYLWANHLPVTASTVEMIKTSLNRSSSMGNQLHEVETALASVAEALRAVIEEGGPSDEGFQPLVDRTTEHLSKLIMATGGEDRTRLVESLRLVFNDQGTSIESRLARLLSGDADLTELEEDLRVLLGKLADTMPAVGSEEDQLPQLQRALTQLRHVAPVLVDALQSQQLRNAAEPQDTSEPWLYFQVPFLSGHTGYPRIAELRVSRRFDREIDPSYVRLVFRLDLRKRDTVEVRLDVFGKQIRCNLASDNEEALTLLDRHFASLRQGLEGLGYVLGPANLGKLPNEIEASAVAVEVPHSIPRLDIRV